MGTLMQDAKYAIRMLMKNPGFTFVAVITLALGIGANTAIFSMMDSFLLRPLPVKDPAQITVLAFQQKNGPVQNQFSIAEYRDVKSQTSDVFSDLFGFQWGMDGLKVNGKPDRIMTNYVTGNFFSGLGIKPALGRFILPTEGENPGADPVMVLGYTYWKSHFNSDPSVIGKQVTVDGSPITIVGVAPEGFYGVYPLLDAQGYLPLGMATSEGNPSDFMENRGNRNFGVLARLRSGVNLKQANAALGVVGRRIAQDHPKEDSDLSLQVFPELRSRPQPDPNDTMLIISGLFLGLAAMVLLLACVNVANILLVRATIREREMAIRSALGAARSRLIRQLLTESVLLALAGGIAGILLGWQGSAMLSSINLQTDLPIHVDFGLDWRIFAFAFAAALLTGIIVGLVPAYRASRGNLAAILHEGGRGVVGGKNRLRSALVVAQVAGSLMLLIIAGLFTRSLGAAQRTNLGFDPSHVLTLSMDPQEIAYNETQGIEFYKNLLDRIRALPGVEAASTSSSVPMGYINNADTLQIDGYQPPPGRPAPFAFESAITPDYLQTMNIPLLRGRSFTAVDTNTTQYVAIVNEAMAKSFWPGQDPIGRQFKMNGDSKHSMQVVGIARDSRFNGITRPIGAYFFVPFAQHYDSNSLEILEVKTAAAPAAMIPAVEQVISGLAPDLPVFDVKTMSEALNTLNGMLIFQIGAVLAASLGILGLILAIVGVYGVVSFTASQRTHEIGVRMALGARPLDILKMIFGQGFTIVGIGLLVGLAAAYGAAQLVGSFLTVSATDPVTYITVSAILMLVALAACYIPARRAMRVDPMVALHYE
jgi:putative ABC transport system permease protein